MMTSPRPYQRQPLSVPIVLLLFVCLSLFSAVSSLQHAEAAAAVSRSATTELYSLFDLSPGNDALKSSFISTFEKLTAESQSRVLKMYAAGKKEQPDKLKLRDGLNATASLLWSLEVSKQFVDEYSANGTALPRGSFIGLSTHSQITEFFPKNGQKVLPLLGSPEKLDRLNDLIGSLFEEVLRKANSDIINGKDDVRSNKDDILSEKTEKAMNDLVNVLVTEILRKAKDEISKNKPELPKGKTESALNNLVETLVGEILRKTKSELSKPKADFPAASDEAGRIKEINEILNKALNLSGRS
jgi:hypothetical protein